MRCVAGAGLLALVGCNQVFGIHATREYDASIDVPPDLPYVKLTWQVAQLLESGAPDPELLDVAIEPAPTVRYAALTDTAWTDGEYNPADGTILVRREYFVPGTTWRLEYTLDDRVPREVQWAPEDKHGQLTVPVFGRVPRERAAAPVGGGYHVTPSGAAAAFTFPRVFTTGLWTEGVTPFSGTTIDYEFASAASLSGPKGRPDPARGDRAVLVDYKVNMGCRTAVGSAALASAAIEPGVLSAPAAAWDSGTRPITSNLVELAQLSRVTKNLGWIGKPITGRLAFGVAASGTMPGLPAVAPSALAPVTQLPVPVMVTLLECPYDVTALPSTSQPAILDAFPRILHAQLVVARQVAGVTLASGLETAIRSETSSFTLAFPAPIPTRPTLAAPDTRELDLAGASEAVDAGPATSGNFTLQFTPEPGGPVADYYEVTLHRLAGLAPERVYTVTAPKVQIDGALLVPGVEYVFQIRSFTGHPNARQGDFRPVAYPYGSGIVFTRTFKTR